MADEGREGGALADNDEVGEASDRRGGAVLGTGEAVPSLAAMRTLRACSAPSFGSVSPIKRRMEEGVWEFRIGGTFLQLLPDLFSLDRVY